MVKKQLSTVVEPAIPPSSQKEKQTVQRVIENITIMETEGKLLKRLIDDILTLSRLQSGKLLLHAVPVNPSDLMESVSDLAESARSKGLQFEYHLPEKLPDVMADKAYAAQVLRHIVENAIKFTLTGKIIISAIQNDDAVKFMVQDTGPGIPQHDLEKIYDHFTQLGSVDKDKPLGLGIGLSLCRAIIGLHHGHLGVESIVGQGCVFHFTLPLANNPPLLPA